MTLILVTTQFLSLTNHKYTITVVHLFSISVLSPTGTHSMHRLQLQNVSIRLQKHSSVHIFSKRIALSCTKKLHTSFTISQHTPLRQARTADLKRQEQRRIMQNITDARNLIHMPTSHLHIRLSQIWQRLCIC